MLLGVFRVDPNTYQTSGAPNGGEVRIVDRITDLPIENSRILSQFGINGNGGNDSDNKPNNKNIYSNILAKSNIDKNNSNRNSMRPNDIVELKRRRASEHFESMNIMSSPASPPGATSFINSIGYYSNVAATSNERTTPTYEYETITTSVPESLAQKIIAEARAAGITHRAGS